MHRFTIIFGLFQEVFERSFILRFEPFDRLLLFFKMKVGVIVVIYWVSWD